MADSFASTEDLVKRWRPLSPTETETAAVLLEDASVEVRLLLKRAGVPEVEVDAAAAMIVVCGMVKRSMIAGDNSPGVTTSQETTGPFSRSFTYANPTGDLYLTKREKLLLGLGAQSAFTIPMGLADG